MELGDLNDDSDQDPAVKDFLGKIDPELFNDDKGGIISEDIFILVFSSKNEPNQCPSTLIFMLKKLVTCCSALLGIEICGCAC